MIRLLQRSVWLAVSLFLLFAAFASAGQQPKPYKTLDDFSPVGDGPLVHQTAAEVTAKSAGCTSSGCHLNVEPMHESEAVKLGCTDCHGGNAETTVKTLAHISPVNKEIFQSAANAVRPYTAWLDESFDYVRFVNPGDLRVLDQTCGSGGCHELISYKNRRSMMTHGGMLWGAALYNNGAWPNKDTQFGESYGADGRPQQLLAPVPVTAEERSRGILDSLSPLIEWAASQPGNILRVFERGTSRLVEPGIPDRADEAGRPDKGLSLRGFGTGSRTDPVFLGLQKTRLLDPLMSLPGTNDHPGDYRASGCTACHVVYANDRSPEHSGSYAKFGNQGRSANPDPTIDKAESGHPIRHRLTRSIPSSQCMVCHMHPGTNMETTFYGATWWDNETDGRLMYPPLEKNLSAKEIDLIQQANPEGSALRGLWSDPEFLSNLTGLNPQLQRTQFEDFHGHGWVFRNVYKRDRSGRLLDADGKIVPFDDPARFQKAVHLKDIHLEKGMHCIDCHFEQDVHGSGKLYNEPRAAVEIDCVDCHGTITKKTTLRTSSFAAPTGGSDLSTLRTPFGRKRFDTQGGRIVQRSMLEPGKEWELVQLVDLITPGSPHYNEKARLAKTVQKDGKTWGGTASPDLLAHSNTNMTCYACHSSWMTSCFGCHLSSTTNASKPALHNEGDITRNWTSYNFQVLRDDVFMLARDGTTTGHRIAPARSSSAVVVSSQNANRESVYQTQQTISAEGFAGQAFSTHVPHTVRATETKTCTDCHVSTANDNNAVMAQLLMLGTGFVNFMGPFAYVGEGREGFEAVAITERTEPMAVIGSDLHKLAYPSRYEKHVSGGRALKESYRQDGKDIRSLQARGEYLYTASGADGLVIYDVAQVQNKGFSDRLATSRVSPLGQRLSVRSRYATAVAAPSTLAVDPARSHRPENDEQSIAPIYGYIFFTDKYEGLIAVGAATLLDGDPENNFLKRAWTFNPQGLLDGASSLTIAGNYVYVTCDRGLVILNLADPLHPKVAAIISSPDLNAPRALAVQFRYAFVLDREGLKIVDITVPEKAHVVPGAKAAIADARDLYLARTYAYVAAGRDGLLVFDIERPEQPRKVLSYNANGQINDAYSVRLAMTNASLFAYIADGRNGLRVLQMISPESSPGSYGFSPPPNPQLIATLPTKGPATALSRALDRDRAVDESGNQIAVFGRRGARPFNLEEMQRLYLRNGQLYRVTDPKATVE